MFIFISQHWLTCCYLRVYAITSKNKVLLAYFGSISLTRLAVSLASNLIKPPDVIDLPLVPFNPFNLCGFVVYFQFKTVPHSLGTAFGT